MTLPVRLRRIVCLTLCLLTASLAALLPFAVRADDSLTSITNSGVLRVGVDAPYGRMEYYDDDGSLTGVDVDVARQLASDIGVSVEFVTMPFDELFGALKEQRVDVVISAVTITAERQQTMRFSVPYFDAALQIAVRRDDDRIRQLADLPGKRVGVLAGTVGEGFANQSDLISNDLVVRFKNNDARVKALGDGQVDAIIMHFSLKDHPTLRTLPEPVSQSYYGVVGRLGDKALIEAVDQSLRAMKRDRRLDAIRHKHLENS